MTKNENDDPSELERREERKKERRERIYVGIAMCVWPRLRPRFSPINWHKSFWGMLKKGS